MADTPTTTSPTQQEEAAVKGSIFTLNGASFSGADIKVLIHVYDAAGSGTGSRVGMRIDELWADASEEERLLTSLKAEKEAIKAQPNWATRFTDRLVSLQARISAVETEVHNLWTEIDRLGKIGKDDAYLTTKVLGELQTLSVSTHREKVPVRTLGSVNPIDFTRGPRAIAGSMIFTVFDQHVLNSMLYSANGDLDIGSVATTALLDQMPPFDITIAFANEYGRLARMSILGCEFVNEGQTMSIEDLFLENTVQYVARDIDPMRSVAQRLLDPNGVMTGAWGFQKASMLLDQSDYKSFGLLSGRSPWGNDPFQRKENRANPYI